jgi:hypothetical protein
MEDAGPASSPDTATVVAAAEGASMEIHPPHAAPRSIRDFMLQLGTITAGVLIALSLEGMLEWNHYRLLVREAKETIARELADNKKELEGAFKAYERRAQNLENASRLVSEILASKKSGIQTMEVGANLPELSSASWRSAERTGALAHMSYADVQRYSRVYDVQDMLVEQQRRVLQQVGIALAALGGNDPFHADAKDLDRFRQIVLSMRGELVIEQQLAQELIKRYETALKE